MKGWCVWWPHWPACSPADLLRCGRELERAHPSRRDVASRATGLLASASIGILGDGESGLPARELLDPRDELIAALDDFRPAGEVLELTCGPGTWTPQLLKHADHVTAVGAVPEMLRIAARDIRDERAASDKPTSLRLQRILPRVQSRRGARVAPTTHVPSDRTLRAVLAAFRLDRVATMVPAPHSRSPQTAVGVPLQERPLVGSRPAPTRSGVTRVPLLREGGHLAAPLGVSVEFGGKEQPGC
jgi:hypothetical protein